jgi:hypothetical protein
VRALAAAVLVALAATACGVPQDAEPRALDSETAPFSLPGDTSRTPDDPAAPTGREQVDLFFVRDGAVVLTSRPVRRTTPVPVEVLLELLLAGPTESELADGLTSVIPSSLTVEDVAIEGRTAVVSLGGPEDQVRSAQALAFAQIVTTLTTGEGVDGVRFRLGDSDLKVPRGDGSLTERALTSRDYAEVTAGATPAVSPPATSSLTEVGPAPSPG